MAENGNSNGENCWSYQAAHEVSRRGLVLCRQVFAHHMPGLGI